MLNELEANGIMQDPESTKFLTKARWSRKSLITSGTSCYPTSTRSCSLPDSITPKREDWKLPSTLPRIRPSKRVESSIFNSGASSPAPEVPVKREDASWFDAIRKPNQEEPSNPSEDYQTSDVATESTSQPEVGEQTQPECRAELAAKAHFLKAIQRPSILPQPTTQKQVPPSGCLDFGNPSETGLARESSDDMAAGFQRVSGDARRYPSSSFTRTENRPPMGTVLCRNGPQCRKFQEGTCNYNHDFSALTANGLNAQKKTLNVESPAFTPAFTPKGMSAQPAKMGISPKAAAAAAFTPRGSGSVTPARNSHSKEPSAEFVPQQVLQAPQQFTEFVPGQSFVPQQQMDVQTSIQTPINAFNDPFLSQAGITGLDGTQPQLNPYAHQTSGVGTQQFFQDTSSYKHPLNYHLYASIGPRRENLMAYQRSTSDLFIPDSLREDLQRKAEATLQTFANSTLPQSVEYFHSLVALDTSNQKGPSTFGYPSWVYKATSSRDGHTYALRRIEGFRLTNEAAIRTVQSWKRISNGSLVQVHDAFTGRWFNDSSLIIVTDYHPMAQTVAEKNFALARHTGASRAGQQIVPENDLWSYIVQIASALKSIHEAGLAAQTVIPSKVLVTSKNRLRLGGCGVLDIVQYEQRKPVTELQRIDLENLGKLILGIAARNQTAHHNVPKALELVSRSYTERLRACIAWLVAPPPTPADTQQDDAATTQISEYNINMLLNNIADKVIAAFDSTLHFEDELTSHMMRELENGRLVRLLTKLNVILERPETSTPTTAAAGNNQPSSAWSETGERYYLKLFRDHVFHQVDHEGRPVLDLGHIITCLNKLDAGIDEKVQLMSRDEQNVFVVTYREVKRAFESAWADVSKASQAGGRR
ncbi:PAB-dependent poly(A)-specific ribonuclease subunit 3 [Vermiconidia calcicola]|uniref:PAB-dependent poly(A)-specific ribonuclease subunit 3 n=1 Tax=Vermiconidia calcicola TaxID=1690605 RepID=A0ACC3MBK2_9PEZI|nr:PAB-dependent poly(A)-specific ribonuclease subunit 3 [Vermiconidia calcicola]